MYDAYILNLKRMSARLRVWVHGVGGLGSGIQRFVFSIQGFESGARSALITQRLTIGARQYCLAGLFGHAALARPGLVLYQRWRVCTRNPACRLQTSQQPPRGRFSKNPSRKWERGCGSAIPGFGGRRRVPAVKSTVFIRQEIWLKTFLAMKFTTRTLGYW